jgi:signal transduction histidine kinase
MKLKNRILLFNLTSFSLVLVCVGIMSFIEFREQHRRLDRYAPKPQKEGPASEAAEVVLCGGAAALLLALLFSRLFLTRTLAPIAEFTNTLEQTNIHNLREPVKRSGNGDELDRMAVVFNRLKERLEMSIHQTREFTMHASHELKTPLAIMHATLEQMISEGSHATPQVQKSESMLEEVQRLTLLSSHLIFLAKADAEQMPMTMARLSLHELVAEYGEECLELGRHRNIRVELLRCDPVVILGDKMRIRQVLLNLADNAVKYNVEGGLIQISLRHEETMAIFTITNLGEVIPPASRDRIFDRFYRGDRAHESSFDGMGLGLSIARIVVELHQGTIVYDVDEAGMNRFVVCFPIA